MKSLKAIKENNNSEELAEYEQWKGEYLPAMIQKFIERNKDIWRQASGREGGITKIKKVLLNEQGFVCCYCGKRISKDKMTIEHIETRKKSIENNNIDKIFDHNNLIASCVSTKHIVSDKDTWISIANKYGINERELKNANKRVHTLSENQLINLPKKVKTCNDRRGDRELIIHPMIEDCDSYFKYHLTGEVAVEAAKDQENTQYAIDILGLNTKNLKDIRKNLLSAIFNYIKKSGQDDLQAIEDLIQKYETSDDKNEKEEFYFVITNYLTTQYL